MLQHEPIYYLQTYKKAILLWSALLLVLITIVGFAAWQQSIEQRRGKLPIAVKTVPADATIYIDGEPLEQGTQYIKPGNYTAKISKPGFHTITQKIRVNDELPAALYVGLAPATDEAKQWQERHRRDYAEIERLGFGLSQDYGQAFKKRWPIVDSLPIKDPYFTISYKNEAEGELVLTIRATSARYRELAIDHLRTKGFEPTNYRIEVVGFKNPLQEEN